MNTAIITVCVLNACALGFFSVIWGRGGVDSLLKLALLLLAFANVVIALAPAVAPALTAAP